MPGSDFEDSVNDIHASVAEAAAKAVPK